MNNRLYRGLAIVAMVFISWSCQNQLDTDALQDMVLISEISDDNSVIVAKKAETNWIPGSLFPRVDADYLVFSQAGELSIVGDDAHFSMMMVPYEYRNITGLAPEESYIVSMSLDCRGFIKDGKKYSLKVKDEPVTVNFDSGRCCTIDGNTITATVSFAGSFTGVEKVDAADLLSGFASMTLKLSTGESIDLTFKELYLHQY